MKNLICFLLVTGLVISCSEDNGFNVDEYPQKWELVKMSSVMTGWEATGDEMSWQESYTLYSDNSFVKSRERDNQITKAEGTYEIKSMSDGEYLVLTYNSENDLIGSCTSEPVEQLRINSGDQLNNTWGQCDGPSLEYRRIE